MSENSIDSICEFLLHAGTDFRIYDVGRGIQPIPSQTFLQLENGEFPTPSPRQQQGWYALVFWQAAHAVNLNASRQYIWFLRLPVDEQSKIVNAARTHFLRTIVDALQQDPSMEKGLPDNPYIFTPAETLRAQLTAKVKADLNQLSQQDSIKTFAYINAPGTVDWRNISMQEVHYAVYQLTDNSKVFKNLEQNWSQLAPAFLNVLLCALENIPLPDETEQFFIQQIKQSQNAEMQTRLLLALHNPNTSINVSALLALLLSDPRSSTLSLLSVIAGRYGTSLSPALLSLFFQRCHELDESENADGEIIKGFYEDLVRLPAIRPHVLQLIR
ncbi:DUF3549 family protein [Alteromonas sediminis]|nr:DUF3549 family protein [Alteromonas sediminis]